MDEAIVKQFLSELEVLFTKKEEELKQKKKLEEDSLAIQDLLGVLSVSYKAFTEGVVNMLPPDKEKLITLFHMIFQDPNLVSQIMNQIYNYYYLIESTLLEEPIVAPQKEYAEQVLGELREGLTNYLKQVESKTKGKEREALENYISKLVLTGYAFTDGKLDRPIEDLDFLEEVMKEVSLTEEEKMTLLTKIWLENVSLYQEILSKDQQIIEVEIAGDKEQVREDDMDVRVQKKNAFSSEEANEKVDSFLDNDEIFQKIVWMIDDSSLKEIDIQSMNPFLLKEIRDLAKEELILTIYEENVTPEEALQIFFNRNDQREIRAKEILKRILDKDFIGVLTEEEQFSIIEKARDFVLSTRKQVERMSSNDRAVLDNYISSLYRSKNSRITMYKKKALNKEERDIKRDAAYECNYFIHLYESIHIDTDEDFVLASKICKRIQEVLDSYYVATKDTERDFIPEGEQSLGKYNVFFLKKNNLKTFFEDDIQLGNDNKGIPKAYYDGIENSLSQLETNGADKVSSILGSWKSLQDLGVKYKSGNRTGVFYIPVGEKDMIILGVGFINGRENNFREADMRVKLNEKRIQKMMEELSIEEKRSVYEIEAKEIRNRLKVARENKRQEEMEDELKTMLEEKVEEGKEPSIEKQK